MLLFHVRITSPCFKSGSFIILSYCMCMLYMSIFYNSMIYTCPCFTSPSVKLHFCYLMVYKSMFQISRFYKCLFYTFILLQFHCMSCKSMFHKFVFLCFSAVYSLQRGSRGNIHVIISLYSFSQTFKTVDTKRSQHNRKQISPNFGISVRKCRIQMLQQ